MELRDVTGSRPPALPNMQQVPATFGAYYHRGGLGFASGSSLMTSPPSGIHSLAAMRYPSNLPVTISASPDSPTSYPSEGAPTIVTQPTSTSPFPGMGMGMGVDMASGEPMRKKRGRPRKYGAENGLGKMALGLSPLSTTMGSPREKRGRGSGRKAQMSALGASGQGFTPHVITIAAGEDVAMKILAFVQHGPWAVCILSANGSISNVTLRQPFNSGGTVTYEGRYEILSLMGSFLLTESCGTRSRVGSLSVSLAGADGRVIGGGVGGLLMAASPVQVVMGTFLPESRKNQVRSGGLEPHPGNPSAGTTVGTPLAVPMATPSRVDATGSLHDHISGVTDHDTQQQTHAPHVMSFQSMGWSGSHFHAEARDVSSSPDGS
eukprot:c28406_g1_i1 orf=827-1960(-)